MLGRLLRQDGMEAGTRWVLPNALGQPIRGWDSRGHAMRMTYDPLGRRIRRHVSGPAAGPGGAEILADGGLTA